MNYEDLPVQESWAYQPVDGKELVECPFCKTLVIFNGVGDERVCKNCNAELILDSMEEVLDE